MEQRSHDRCQAGEALSDCSRSGRGSPGRSGRPLGQGPSRRLAEVQWPEVDTAQMIKGDGLALHTEPVRLDLRHDRRALGFRFPRVGVRTRKCSDPDLGQDAPGREAVGRVNQRARPGGYRRTVVQRNPGGSAGEQFVVQPRRGVPFAQPVVGEPTPSVGAPRLPRL